MISYNRIEGKYAFTIIPYKIPESFTKQAQVTSISNLSPATLTSITRKIALLPTNEEYRANWKKLGMNWMKDEENLPFFAPAYLPVGWKIKEKPTSSSLDSYIIFNDKDVPQVEMTLKTAFYDPFATVNFLILKPENVSIKKIKSDIEI